VTRKVILTAIAALALCGCAAKRKPMLKSNRHYIEWKKGQLEWRRWESTHRGITTYSYLFTNHGAYVLVYTDGVLTGTYLEPNAKN
jgi:hypothetical protein